MDRGDRYQQRTDRPMTFAALAHLAVYGAPIVWPDLGADVTAALRVAGAAPSPASRTACGGRCWFVAQRQATAQERAHEVEVLRAEVQVLRERLAADQRTP